MVQPNKKRMPKGPSKTVGKATVIRMATEADVEAILAIWLDMMSYHHNLDNRHWNLAPDGAEKFAVWMRGSVGAEDKVLLIAEAGGNVVGFLHGIFKESPPVVMPRKSGYITDAAVMESHRRGGLGKRLLAAAEEWYSAHGADDIYLAAAIRNDIGLGFWTSQGFESITVSMWKPLKAPKPPAKPAVRRRRE